MRIQPYQPSDQEALKVSFPGSSPGPSAHGKAVVCEDAGVLLAYAWAERVLEDSKGAWTLRGLEARGDHRNLGLEPQVLLTLEIEIEKGGGKSLGAWTPADLPEAPPSMERAMFRERGYLFRVYEADHFGPDQPGDFYMKPLENGPLPVETEPKDQKMKFRFPMVGLN